MGGGGVGGEKYEKKIHAREIGLNKGYESIASTLVMEERSTIADKQFFQN